MSQSLADRVFPGTTAIGQEINIGTVPYGQHIQIVGVVNDVTLYDVKAGTRLSLFIPVSQDSEPNELIVTLRGHTSDAAVRQAVGGLGRHYVFRVQSVDEIAERAISQEQLTAAIASTFGALALLLAAVGLYGLLAYTVTRRRRDFAIRIALGGRYAAVMGLVVRQGSRVTVAGLCLGMALAVVTVRAVQPLLSGVPARDPWTLTVVPLLLTLVAGLACLVPASRAARVDPLSLLRDE